MLVSLNFVERFVSLPQKSRETIVLQKKSVRSEPDIDLLAPMLTQQGFEVERVEYRGVQFDQVIVGKIAGINPHPNADRLNVCQVNVGDGRMLQIVCGAKNASKDLYVAVALPGVKISGDVMIQESQIRGIPSSGMLCSRGELGLPVCQDIDGDGIWSLDVDCEGGSSSSHLQMNLGNPVFDVLGLRDILLDLNVTPNRPDMLYHWGVAAEIAAGLKFAGISYEWKNETSCHLAGRSLNELVSDVASQLSAVTPSGAFSVENRLGVSAFFVMLENVKVCKTPGWLRNLLESLGHNSVNCVVDVLNFVLLAFGQPSHAFDLEKLSRNHLGDPTLCFRYADPGEQFIGLDGKTRVLVAQDCVVADSKNVQALLGVVGGELSKVEFNSTRIVLEFANPHPVAVRRTSRRHGRKTDSSFIFEKGREMTLLN